MQDTPRFTIKHLSLGNYRRFESLDVDLDDRLTVVVGDNGVGKTALIDALAVAAGAVLSKVEDASAPSIYQRDVRSLFVRQGSTVAPQGQYPVTVSASGEMMGRELSWSRSLSSSKGRTTTRDAKDAIELGARLQRLVSAGEGVVLPVIARYDANRFARGASSPLPDSARSFIPSRTRGYAGAFDATVDEGRTLTWMRNMTIWEIQEGKESPELSSVKHAIAASLAGIGGVEVGSVRFDMQQQDVLVTYRDPSGIERTDSAASMSEGYRSAMLMFADIARRMAQLNPHLLGSACEAPGIVLVDEVDLHLHPRWQAHILGDLAAAFPNVQFVVTTHSPAVISSVPRESVRVLRGNAAEEPRAATFGREIGDIAETVMGANSRPAGVQVLIDRCRGLLDAGDLAAADAALADLEARIGDDDPELVGMRTDLALEQL